MSTSRVASRQAPAPPDLNSLYVVAAWVPRRETIVVGALGPVTFARGWHAYVGSARRGRDARVARHRRADKPLRWHADYLFARHPATRAWLLDTPLSECELAARLRAAGAPGRNAAAVAPGRGGAPGGPAATGNAPVAAAPRFGASDCDCPGHLLHAQRLDALRATLARIPGCRGRRRAGPTDPRTESARRRLVNRGRS
jgi:Uri superfamily endonuclease